MPRQSAAEYRRLPYRRRVEKVEAEGQTSFVAFIQEIPWIRAIAGDHLEATKLLDEMFDDSIEAMLSAGDEVPEPPSSLEAFGVAPTPITDLMTALRTATQSMPEPVTFARERDVQPWRDVEIRGGRLEMAGAA